MPVSAVLPRDYTADPARDRADTFHCFLADQPEYLVPERLFVPMQTRPAAPLSVSRNAWFAWREPLPSHIAELYPLPEAFLDGNGIVWVNDGVTGMQWPFWAGPRFQRELAGLSRGRTAPPLAPHHVAALVAAGVLEVSEGADHRAAEWQNMVKEAAAKFARTGVATLSGLIHPFHLGALRRYYRRMVRTGGMRLGDSGSPLRHAAYNESIARFFHRQVAHTTSAVVGTRIKPTFAYVVSYPGGADLEIHTDRAQCQYAVSLLVDFIPEPPEQSPWPLVMHTKYGPQSIWQSLGDAVLYRGTEIPHERAPLADEATSTSVLFYFVDENFADSLD